MKLGLDLHGVIDSAPKMFHELTKTLVLAGHEVHILTGPKIGWHLKMGIAYTHLFSITDYCESKGIQVEWDEHNNPHVDPYHWDKAKAEYCQEHGIDLHIDDSDAYGYFFKTPYARFYSKDTNRVKKTKI